MPRYEDGDAEHLQWADLRHILLSLPARDDAQIRTVVSKPKGTAARTSKLSGPANARVSFDNKFAADTCGGFIAGAAGVESAKKQKVSPAGPASAKKQRVLPAPADSARRQKVSPAGVDSAKKQTISPAGTDATNKQELSPTNTLLSPKGAFTRTLSL